MAIFYAVENSCLGTPFSPVEFPNLLVFFGERRMVNNRKRNCHYETFLRLMFRLGTRDAGKSLGRTFSSLVVRLIVNSLVTSSCSPSSDRRTAKTAERTVHMFRTDREERRPKQFCPNKSRQFEINQLAVWDMEIRAGTCAGINYPITEHTQELDGLPPNSPHQCSFGER